MRLPKFLRSEPLTVPVTPLTNWDALRAREARSREVAALERANLLREYEILEKEDGLSAAQYTRLGQLAQLLWPPSQPNPMNGIRRVPGGHGFPIPDQAAGVAYGEHDH